MSERPEVYENGRRSEDRLISKWLPILIQIAMTLLALGVLYGRLDGRLQLIEFRIGVVESRVGRP